MRKRGSVLWYVVVITLAVALVAIIGWAIWGGSFGNRNSSTGDGIPVTDDDDDRSNAVTGANRDDDDEAAPPQQGKGSELFVMFGVDSRSNKLGKGTRSDSLMLVRVDHDAEEVKVISIYRDCMLYQGEKGYKKITNAHSYGGPDFAVSVINENFDLSIENYCTVNFNSVGDLVDMIGGVEMEITEEEVQYINAPIKEVNAVRGTNSAYITEPGTYLLDGTQAVAYSRIRRAAGGDYKRAERQRDVLFKVFEKSKDLSRAKRLEIVDTMLDEISTNYDSDEILVLMYYISEYEITTMTAYPKVFYGGSVDGAWVEVPCTLVDMNKDLHEILLDETDYEPSDKVKEISETLRNKVSGPNNDQRDDGE